MSHSEGHVMLGRWQARKVALRVQLRPAHGTSCHIPYRARLMILSLSCQAQTIQTSLPHKRTSLWFRSTQRFQTHTRSPARTRRGHHRSPIPFYRPCRSFGPFAASSEDKDSMPEVTTDMLFAAAMPKEEIGALDFLKVLQVGFSSSSL